MNSRMDVCSPRQNKDKTFWVKVGTFWPAKDGKVGGQIVFDALPLPDKEGRVAVSLFEPKEKGERPAKQTGGDMDNDSIPF